MHHLQHLVRCSRRRWDQIEGRDEGRRQVKRRNAHSDEPLQEHRVFSIVVVEITSARVMMWCGVPGEVGMDRLRTAVMIRPMTAQVGVNQRGACGCKLNSHRQPDRDQGPEHIGIIEVGFIASQGTASSARARGSFHRPGRSRHEKPMGS